ncbi:MAG: hypothetical protein KF902_04150 [Phycisphaeraceae bacterium]|nr:hypothetical protein [Phycisphaeraceae bacterium]
MPETTPVVGVPKSHNSGASANMPSGSVTRAQIVAIGQSDRPWEFVGLAHRALAAHPLDAGVRFLLATNYAKLGLRTAASEQIAHLPSEVVNDPAVMSVRAAIERLADDRVGVDEREAILRGNVEAIIERGALGAMHTDMVQIWREASVGIECFRTLSGGVLSRVCDPAERANAGGGWLRFANEVPPARSQSTKSEGDPVVTAWPRPVTIEGFNPWVLRHVADGLARLDSGYWARINVLESDFQAFVRALSVCDIREVLGQTRVHLFVGEDAVVRFRADLEARNGTQILGPVIVCRGCGTGGTPVVENVVRDAVIAQKAEETRLVGEFDRDVSVRTTAAWRERYASALRRTGTPLRLLVATCRYTTFVKHSALDIAEAMRDAGHEAEVLVEPDESSLLSTVGYLRKIREFAPDMVLVINRTRTNLKGMIPAGIPMVCWIQDAMAEIYDDQVGGAQGEMDFLVGHTNHDLFAKFGYPRERSLMLPVVASERKFRTEPADASSREAFVCDVAYVSHHSETPDRLHERVAAMAGDLAVAATLEALRPRVRDAVAKAAEIPLQSTLRQITEEAARHVIGRDADPRVLTRICNQYTLPLADRLLRHETLRWAASICERRGWRLMIHGRGWDGHEAFARYAARPIEHGDELRASYQAAGAHLHVSVHWPFHQRVMECALSGGMPLCRAKWDDLAMLHGFTAMRLADAGVAHACRVGEPKMHLYAVADHPEAMRMVGLWQRMGDERGNRPNIPTTDALLDAARLAWEQMPRERDVAWMLGDPSETMYRNEMELEGALERAITRPRWRESASAGIAGRVRKQFTYRVAIERIIALVSGSLGVA